MTPEPATAPGVAGLAAAVLAGDRGALARALTLVESSRRDHRREAREMVDALLPHAGRAERVAISGVPGAGKSTLIDALGTQLTAAGHRVAVLAIDPSSTRSGGSILGDKTRMARLANDPAAFVRPSPTSGTLGGVAGATREAMVVVEAAGYDVVLVETVGVGQSEVAVGDMVDCSVVVLVARGGDGLQAIKRGILEMAEVVVVNKADEGREAEAARTAAELTDALALFESATPGWTVPVLTGSALTGAGMEEVWTAVQRHRETLAASGERARRRSAQAAAWMWATVRARLLERLQEDPSVAELAAGYEARVRTGSVSPLSAAEEILDRLGA